MTGQIVRAAHERTTGKDTVVAVKGDRGSGGNRGASRIRRPRGMGQFSLLAALFAGSLLMLVPLAWVALSSLKEPAEILRLPVQWLPDNFFNFDNYVQLFADHNFGRYMTNSFIVTGIGIGTSLVIALLAAYAFAYHNFRFKEPLFLLVLALFMVPQEALVIPMYSKSVCTW